jgi:hypothetical protein
MYDESYDVSYRWRDREEEDEDYDDGDYCVCDNDYDSVTGNMVMIPCDWCCAKELEEKRAAKLAKELAERDALFLKQEERRKTIATLNDFVLRSLHGDDYVEAKYLNDIVAAKRPSCDYDLYLNLIHTPPQPKYIPKLKVYLNYFANQTNKQIARDLNAYCELQRFSKYELLANPELEPVHDLCRQILQIPVPVPFLHTEQIMLQRFIGMNDYAFRNGERLAIVETMFRYIQTIIPFMNAHPNLRKVALAKLEEFKEDPKAVPIRDTLLAAEKALV